MNAGRDLDALVAERIFGHTVVRNLKGGWSIGEPDYYDSYGELILANPLPMYSEDIAAAWDVLEKLDSLGIYHIVGNCEFSYLGHRPGSWVGLGKILTRPEVTYGDSVAHAICLAALKALGVEV